MVWRDSHSTGRQDRGMVVSNGSAAIIFRSENLTAVPVNSQWGVGPEFLISRSVAACRQLTRAIWPDRFLGLPSCQAGRSAAERCPARWAGAGLTCARVDPYR